MQIDDSPLGGVTYARFFPSDWRSGCFCLNLEEEGLYIRCCAWMYDTGQPIPGNDASAAKLLHVQTQKYSKVMQSLIDKGKMTRAQGVIVNTRVLAEIDKYRAQRAGRSMAAKKREEEKAWRLERELTNALSPKNAVREPELALTTPPPTPPPTPQATPPRLPPPSPPTSPDATHPGYSKNINEINRSTADACQSSAKLWANTGNPESRSHKEEETEERTTAATSESRPVSGSSGDGEFVSLNGTTDAITEFIATAAHVDRGTARIMLRSNIQIYGAKPLMEAYAIATAKMATEIVASPYKYFLNTASGLRDKAASRGQEGQKRKLMQRY